MNAVSYEEQHRNKNKGEVLDDLSFPLVHKNTYIFGHCLVPVVLLKSNPCFSVVCYRHVIRPRDAKQVAASDEDDHSEASDMPLVLICCREGLPVDRKIHRVQLSGWSWSISLHEACCRRITDFSSKASIRAAESGNITVTSLPALSPPMPCPPALRSAQQTVTSGHMQ
jgi:hypothetical protein